eukprot:6207154-Pleurochrysis_carterae.AAC.2
MPVRMLSSAIPHQMISGQERVQIILPEGSPRLLTGRNFPALAHSLLRIMRTHGMDIPAHLEDLPKQIEIALDTPRLVRTCARINAHRVTFNLTLSSHRQGHLPSARLSAPLYQRSTLFATQH